MVGREGEGRAKGNRTTVTGLIDEPSVGLHSTAECAEWPMELDGHW
jgi:hypothetical protein